MKKRRLYFVEPSKVGRYHITLLDGYITALLASTSLAEHFDIVFYLCQSTFENLPVATRDRIVYRRIPVINQDLHHVVRKSLLEFIVMARILFSMRRDDMVFVSCIMPTALLLLEVFNRVMRRRGIFVTIHGEEIEPYVEGRTEHWRQLGFWGEKWLRWRKRDSLFDIVTIDDFIKTKFAETCSDKLDPDRIFVVHYPITRYARALSAKADKPSVCFIGFRTRSKGFQEFERLSRSHSDVTFLVIGQGKVEDLRTGDSWPIVGIDAFMQAIAGCSVAILPYTDSYTCILSASALDTLSVGTHIVATDRPFFVDLAGYFGPDFITVYRTTDELSALLGDARWLTEWQSGQMLRLDALNTSRYSIDAVRKDFERLFLSSPKIMDTSK
jgi:glycosyltransferase involved in cell wall biosynthesis